MKTKGTDFVADDTFCLLCHSLYQNEKLFIEEFEERDIKNNKKKCFFIDCAI